MDAALLHALTSDTLKHLSVEYDSIDIHETEGHIALNVKSKDSKMLIGANGDTLRALNTLVRRMVEKRSTENVPFLIDVNGYYDKRIYHLKQQAKLLADRARTFKSDVSMPPMNPYERMVVHALFANDPEIYTESMGIGKNRHVVIRYRSHEREHKEGDSELLK